MRFKNIYFVENIQYLRKWSHFNHAKHTFLYFKSNIIVKITS